MQVYCYAYNGIIPSLTPRGSLCSNISLCQQTAPTTPEKFTEMAEKQAQEILSRATTAADAAGVDNDSVSTISDIPYVSIIEAATNAGCDLIFMASHGRRGFSGLLLGSETQKVLTHSKIPVLVYR